MKKKHSKGTSSITRRDFVGGTLVGSGAALLTAQAPGFIKQAKADVPDQFPQMIPSALNNLDESWTGPGGVGDYASANGNTHKVVNSAHTFRNHDFDAKVRLAKDTGEHYDLVCVGAGFAGITAAYTYLKEKPDARVLIFDNHSMFGGEARQNEFEVDGLQIVGSTGINRCCLAAGGCQKNRNVLAHVGRDGPAYGVRVARSYRQYAQDS